MLRQKSQEDEIWRTTAGRSGDKFERAGLSLVCCSTPSLSRGEKQHINMSLSVSESTIRLTTLCFYLDVGCFLPSIYI